MLSKQSIGPKQCFIYDNEEADIFLIQAVGEHELKSLERETELIKEYSDNTPFSFAAFLIKDWNRELSPWEADAVMGKDGFGGEALDTLCYITDILIPKLTASYRYKDKLRFGIGGYSLSGLFALFAAYNTDVFDAVAAVSPSVWFPEWLSYAQAHSMQAAEVYLSLGEKEEKTKNEIMSKVGDNIREQYTLLREDKNVKSCILEWNNGNHFTDCEKRTAKGFAWLINRRQPT